MALRRLAQTNAASSSTSPRLSSSTSTPFQTSPSHSSPATPATPRTRLSFAIHPSPASTPSISSSTPFDWDAARLRRPPPYASPLQDKRQRMLARKSNGPSGTPPKRVVRKKGLVERITSVPSQIAFEIALFPHNVPLPAPKTAAWLIGGALHFLHLCVRISQIRKVPDSDLGWEDMYREGEDEPWLDWTVPVSFILVTASILNAVYLFSRIRLYRMHHRPELVSSPNAAFVSAQLDFEPLVPPPLTSRIRAGAWATFLSLWRFLLGMGPAPHKPGVLHGKVSRVQQLSVWNPGELELRLFGIYSPVHAMMWMATTSANWMLMLFVMGMIGAQIRYFTVSFQTLLKDKQLIAAEVMSEYNQGFVHPRVFPVRKDAAVMTHQSEVVNVWED